MTKTLQDLIDESIFISTEYQAALAELTGGSDWSVDFSAPSFTLQSDPSVALTPYLLGTESEQRGSWIWAWQEMGHFPDAVVSAAVQAREFGEEHGVAELGTDELVLSEGLARRLTLAAKTATGIYAHYPAAAGGGVRAWLLLDGPQFELPEPTVNRMGRVMAEALQTGTAVHHQRAVDSYARLRGAHIEWDTDACAVVTASDGALRLWFDGQQLTGVESAEPALGQRELAQAAKAAQKQRAQLRKEAQRALQLAHREAEEQRRAREEAEARRVAQTQAAVAAQDEQDVASTERSATEQEIPSRIEVGEPREDAVAESRTAAASADGVEQARYEGGQMPFDQDPRADVEPGLVSTHVVAEDEEEAPLRDAHYYEDAQQEPVASGSHAAPEPEDSSREERDRLRRLEQEQAVQEQTEVAPAHSAADAYPEEPVTDEQPVVRGSEPSSEQSAETEDRHSALDRLRSGRTAQEEGLLVEHTEEIQPAEAQDRSVHPEYGEYDEDERRTPEREQEGKKKGFFSRFFGL